MSDVRFVGFSDPIYFLRAPKKDGRIFKFSWTFPRNVQKFLLAADFRTSGPIPNSWKFHHSISCWLSGKRCHELLIQCAREIQMWRCTVVVFSFFWRLRPKMPKFTDWVRFFLDLDLVPRFFRKKTDVYLPVGCQKHKEEGLSLNNGYPKLSKSLSRSYLFMPHHHL